MRDARNSTTHNATSGFTAINDTKQPAATLARASSTSRVTNNDTKKHPAFVAQYLGLAGNDMYHSHLDQLANFLVTPPPSPGEKKIPKRKRAGERHAKEIKQTAKRSRSISDNGLEFRTENLAQKANRKLEVSRQRVPPVLGRHQLQVDHNSDCSLEPDHAYPRNVDPAVSVSDACLSRISKWEYRPEAIEPVAFANSRQNGVVSLIAPVTSMDLYRTCSDPDKGVPNLLPTPLQQPQVSDIPRSNSQSWTRRAPSTGEALTTIPEEPCLLEKMNSRKANKGNLRDDSDMTLPSLDSIEFRAAIPVFHTSPSLVSTTKEVFPPVKRRHELKDEKPLHVVGEDLEDYFGLDDDDLLELGVLSKAETFASGLNDSCKTTTINNSQCFALPTPHVSDEVVYLSDDDADEWSQLSDDELQALDLTRHQPVVNGGVPLPRHNECSPRKALSITEDNHVNPKSALNFSSSPYSVTPTVAPFARPKFPKSVRDRSPLLGITPSLTLKTCFRIGEAIDVGTKDARRSSTTVSEGILIELFARVSSSTRRACPSGVRQQFVFADLWTRRGPTINGEWASWKGSKVFESDAANLSTDDALDTDAEKMCRTVGRMKREKKAWKFIVLNAWECGWDHVEYARGIICRDESE